MAFQCPGGVGVLTPSAHLYTMASWSRVRFSTELFTSASSCAIFPDDVEGGAGGRSFTMSVGVIIQAFTWPNRGSIGGRGGDSMLFHGVSPRAAAAFASACTRAGLPPAVLMP